MTRRSRRSLSHLFAIMGLSGLVTLAVAVTDADDVWLAVGPLLLVILDTLAFSPVVQSNARKAARKVPGLAPPKPRGLVAGFPGRPSYAPATASYRRVRLAGPLTLAVLIAAVVGVLVNFDAPIWAFVTANTVTLGLAALVIVALTLTTLQMGMLSERSPSLGTSLAPGQGPAAPWLQDQLTAVGDSPLSIVVIKAADISAPLITAACADVVRGEVGQVHYLSDTEILLVVKPEDVRKALLLFGLGPWSRHPARPVRMGEVTYPDDGRDPDALIQTARLRLAERSD